MISARKNHFIVEYRPTAIRAARVSSSSTPSVIEEVLELDLGSDATVADQVRRFAGAKGSSYLQASCAVYPSNRIVRHLRIEASKGKEAAFVIDYLKSNAGVDPDSFAAFCLSAEDGRDAELSAFNKKAVLLCGAPKSDIAEVQNELVNFGIYPGRLEFGTIGSIGVLKEALGEGDGGAPMLFLEINGDCTNAVIVGPKGVEMARRIDCGASHVATALREEMNLKDDAAAEKILISKDFDLGPIAPKILRKLLRELQSSIGFFEVQTGYSVSRVFCIKQGRKLDWLESSVCDLLNLKPLKWRFKDWLEERGITLGSEQVASTVDETWLGLVSLLLDLESGKAAK